MEKNTPGKYSGTNTHRDNIKGQNNLTFQSKYELIKYLVQRKHTQATEFYLNTTYCLLGLKDNRNKFPPTSKIYFIRQCYTFVFQYHCVRTSNKNKL